MQTARLQIQFKQIVHIRLDPAEFENSFKLVEIPETMELLPDLNRSGEKRGRTARPARKTRSKASFHGTPVVSTIYRRYICNSKFSDLFTKICAYSLKSANFSAAPPKLHHKPSQFLASIPLRARVLHAEITGHTRARAESPTGTRT
jgi:hypothetical protein